MHTGAVIPKGSPALAVGDEENAAISFAKQLKTAELLTGTPTVVELGTSDLTIGSIAINSAEIEVNGVQVAIGKAVQFTVKGQTAPEYHLHVTATTTLGAKKNRYPTFHVVPAPS